MTAFGGHGRPKVRVEIGVEPRALAGVTGEQGAENRFRAIKAGIDAQQAALGPQYDQAFEGAKAVNTQALANDLDTQAVNLRGPAQQAVKSVRGMLNVDGTSVLDPRPQTLLATRQAIDGKLATEADPKAIAALTNARQQVDGALQQAVPGIKDVDAQWQQLQQQKEGVDFGRKVFSGGENPTWPQETQQTITDAAQPSGSMIGPSAAGLRMQQGARGKMAEIVGQNINDPLALARAIKGQGDFPRENARAIFGADSADPAFAAVDREKTFNDTTNDVYRNSNTAMRQAFAQKLGDVTAPMEIPSNATWEGMTGHVLSKAWNALRAGASERAGSAFASPLGSASVATGAPRDAMVSALLAQAAKGHNAGDLTPGAQLLLRSVLQSGAMNADR